MTAYLDLQLQRLYDISLELRRQDYRRGLVTMLSLSKKFAWILTRSTDLLEEQLSYSSLKLGRDGLRLHANSHFRDLLVSVGLQGTSEHATEGGLSGTVLTHHDKDFGVGEGTTIDLQVEVAQRLLHGWVVEGTGLVIVELVCNFRDPEGQGLVTESQVLGWDVAVQENVDTLANAMRECHDTIDGRLAVEYADVIREVIQHTEIVLDNLNRVSILAIHR